MALEPVIQCFKEEFERFWGLLEKLVEVCPEDLWGKKAGGDVFWQQIWHAMAIAEVNTVEDLAVKIPAIDQYSREVALLSKTLDRVPGKAEILEHGRRIKQQALAYYDSMTVASLTQEHPAMTKRLRGPHTRQHAALALIRHVNYHIGACDAILREYGHPGVY